MTDAIADDLRRWAAMQDSHRRAAVNLLLEHDYWLRRPDFTAAAVDRHGSVRYLNFRKAREFAGTEPTGSTSQLAILDLAVALGEDRFRFGIMGHAHTGMILDAVREALGITNG